MYKLIIIFVLHLSCYALPVPNDSLIYKKPFKQVVIWGYPLHSHTHSWIHWAFNRAFEHLGYNTLWLTDEHDTTDISFENTLFITSGTQNKKIPIRTDCRYIFHNCEEDGTAERYKPLYEHNNVIRLQVYTHKCVTPSVEKIDDYSFVDLDGLTIYMPWATDLLPHEINTVKKNARKTKKTNTVHWIGTIGNIQDGPFGNSDIISPFIRACTENHIEFRHHWRTDISMSINQKLIQESYMAPTLVGRWQLEQGYIPCRIFKNISYGQMGVTNSKTVYELFHGKIVYNEDPYQLFYDAQKYIQEMNIQELYELMDFVRDNHTYLNRIHHLFNFMDRIKPLIND
jgi:hypothetical protein